MQISFVETKDSCFISVIDNIFSQQELVEIKKELTSLYEPAKNPIYSGKDTVATDSEGTSKRKSNSLFLDIYFENRREDSRILNINRKIFFDKFLIEALINKSMLYRHITNCTKDHTLINFYSANDYYDCHKDSSCFTALSFFELEPFTGGNLIFPEFNLTITSNENRMVIFPGFLEHGSTKVEKGVRVSMAQFINYAYTS
jgi:Rps23 Pro-64 3,4-dihydroxylase Tpa1-like proline 4-hydroxylase